MFENPFAEVSYDSDTKVITLNYLSRAPNAQFVPINHKVLEIFRTLSDCNRFLADTREIGALTRENQDWVIQELFPQMVEHLGGKTLYHAQVLSEDMFAQLGLANIRKGFKHPNFVVSAFRDYQESMDWLLEQPGI